VGRADLTEKVLSLFDAWNRGDFEGWASLAGTEVEFRPQMASELEGRVYRGRDGLRRFWDEWHDVWDTVTARVDASEWIGARLLVVGGVNARGRQSGAEVNSPLAWVFDFDGEHIKRTQSYIDIDTARAAAHESG
jgi:ketosteroid isomerase-like protein